MLGVGLTTILMTNAMPLRNVLRPLGRLSQMMSPDDLQHRCPAASHGQRGCGRTVEQHHACKASTSAARTPAQEAERQRIGRELHDEVGQMLTCYSAQKRASNRAPAHLAAELRSLQDSTRISLEELRRIAGRLRPGLLEDLGLISSLNALATGSLPQRGTGPARLRASLPRLSGETELVIYRVTQASATSPGTPERPQSS